MPIHFGLSLTLEKTLENLKTLETQFGFNDALFRNVHHWGKISGASGSLDKHRVYLSGLQKYQNTSSSNYIVAQRIQYILENAVSNEVLGQVIVDARDKYPFQQ